MKNVMMGTKMTTRVVIRIAQELSKDGIVQEVTQLILIHVQKFVETERLLVLKIVMMGTIPITLDVHLDVNLVH